ncbi:DUF7059 domain-containing protein [Bailinhaonella thermotolerans]|uniref:DUF7059 domain-containing protein n=1 Tax=Bailinhaonella thermotolerans TaxID=1070861 RepID=UPI0026880674
MLERLRETFLACDYTIDGVRRRLGDAAATALSREEIVPALRATADLDPLGVLIRLWWLQVPVGAADARRVLGDLPPGLVTVAGDEVRAAVHIQPWEDGDETFYLVSDLKVRPGDPALRPDHVVGAGGASANLAQLAVRHGVETALDLGTGCGVQALHLSRRAGAVTATDVNPRALELSALSFALSGVANVETAEGSLFEPVAGRRFDLVVSNPPFVISPRGRFTYRESGLNGDDVCAELVRGAPGHLEPDGWCHLLANWLHTDAEPWQDRVGGWLAGTGCDGWVVQRDVQDPAEYVELWLRDSVEAGTARYTELYDSWLGWFDSLGVTGIGFGWISLHASGAQRPVVRVEELRHRVELPVGAYAGDVFGAFTTAERVESWDSVVLRAADGLVEERVGPPGAEDPERIVLRQTRGLMRSAQVGTVEAALAGVCDGTMPLGPLLSAIAQLTGEDEAALRDRAPAALRPLVADGFFSVAGD